MNAAQPSAIITGAGRGIGREIARVFAAAGFWLTLVARSRAELEATAADLSKDCGRIVPADVAQPSGCQSVITAALEHAGQLDVLINAAGILGAIAPFWDATPEIWRRAIEVNLIGTFQMMRLAVPHLRLTRGAIINFAGGGDGPMARFSAYSASKAALIRFTETTAEELRPLGIRVNIVAPGAVRTQMLDQVLAATSPPPLASPSPAPSGGGSARPAAELCRFLASEAARPLTGKYISAIWDEWRNWTPEQIAAIAASDRLTLRRLK